MGQIQCLDFARPGVGGNTLLAGNIGLCILVCDRGRFHDFVCVLLESEVRKTACLIVIEHTISPLDFELSEVLSGAILHIAIGNVHNFTVPSYWLSHSFQQLLVPAFGSETGLVRAFLVKTTHNCLAAHLEELRYSFIKI